MSEDREQVHVMPIDDWVEHTPSEECGRKPALDSANEANGTKLYVHFAIDGRKDEA